MTELELKDKYDKLQQNADEILKDCKYCNKLIIKSLIINLLVITMESWCIYNLFVIKHDGFKYLSKNICIICLIFASIIGLRSFKYVMQNIKHLIDIYLIQYYIKNFIK